MTVVSTMQRNDYIGSGISGPYAYTYRIFAASDLKVTTTDSQGTVTTLNYPADYSVAGIGVGSGGSVTLTNVVPVGTSLTITRDPALVQARSVRNQGPFFPETVEDALDYLTMIDQAQQAVIDRSVKLPSAVALPLPEIASFLPTYYLRVTADGRGVEGVTNVVAAQNFIQSGTGAVTRSANAKMAEIFSVTDFGATGNGVTDDTATIQAALDACNAAGGGAVLFPPGTYIYSAALTYGSNTHIVGASWGAILRHKTGLGSPVRTLQPKAIGVSNSVIEGLTIDQRSDVYGNNGQTPAISIDQTIGCTVRCRFLNVQTMAVWCDSPAAHPTTDATLDDVRINGSAGGGISLFGSIKNVRITKPNIQGCQDDAIAVQESENGIPDKVLIDDYTLVNNNRRGNGGADTPHGILIYGCINFAVGNGLIDGTVASGIGVQKGLTQVAKDGTIVSPVIRNAGVTVDSTAGVPGNGIDIRDAVNITVGAPVIDGARDSGIAALNVDGLTVGGFIARNCGANGFRGEAVKNASLGGGWKALDNGQAAGSEASGVLLITDDAVNKCDNVDVEGGQAADTRTGGARTQQYGVFNAGGANTGKVRIRGTNVRGNVAGAIGGSFSTACEIRECPGYNPIGTTSLGAPTGSPYTYTAGTSPVNVSVIGGTVSSITKNGVTLATTTNQVIHLEPAEQLVVTYSVAPTIVQDIG